MTITTSIVLFTFLFWIALGAMVAMFPLEAMSVGGVGSRLVVEPTIDDYLRSSRSLWAAGIAAIGTVIIVAAASS